MLDYCQLESKEQISIKFYWKSNIFIHKNAFENVICIAEAILSWPHCIIFFLNFFWNQDVFIQENSHEVTSQV